MPNSTTLHEKIQLAQRLCPILVALEQPAFDRLLPEYLYRTYCVARASVPLMQAALEQARRREEVGITMPLVDYLTEHIREEGRHAEWVLADLEALGISQEHTLDRVPPASVAALVGAQYYWIQHQHPVALVAYMAVLEGSMPTAATVQSLKDLSRLPGKAFSSLLEHARIDCEHRADLDRLLDLLPLTATHRLLLGISAVHTVSQMSIVLNEAAEAVASSPSAATVNGS